MDIAHLSLLWHQCITSFLTTDIGKALSVFIQQEYTHHTIYPPYSKIFHALERTSWENIHVVILGQDPYHGPGQAHGLAFSVPPGTPLPPSLKNIYKEIESDCGIAKDMTSGDLTSWAQQGVLLLNSILTVEAHKPASHHHCGWELCTDMIIQKISKEKERIVFMLWGKYAQSKKNLIDTKKHLVLEASHPSPFSAYRGFFGCKHFSQCNEYLTKYGKKEIGW
jgi:uracil-DNA glycosylase